MEKNNLFTAYWVALDAPQDLLRKRQYYFFYI